MEPSKIIHQQGLSELERGRVNMPHSRNGRCKEAEMRQSMVLLQNLKESSRTRM